MLAKHKTTDQARYIQIYLLLLHLIEYFKGIDLYSYFVE